jgi:preprotein translocase SecE subunit
MAEESSDAKPPVISLPLSITISVHHTLLLLLQSPEPEIAVAACKALLAFGRDAWREVKKVVWPERKEAVQMTAYVFVFVLVMAVFLWLTDKTLEWLFYDLILGWKK